MQDSRDDASVLYADAERTNGSGERAQAREVERREDQRGEDGGAVTAPAGPPVVVGSVVQLRSGGPVMTVESISGEMCKCVFYAGNLAHKFEHTHSVAAVRIISPTDDASKRFAKVGA